MDLLQKLTDIVLKGVIATALAIGTFLITRDKSLIDQQKGCDDLFVSLLNYVTANELNDRTERILNHRIDRYPAACGTLKDDVVTSLRLSWKEPRRTDPPAGVPDAAPATSWVAVSRIPANNFSDTNFDRLDKPNGALNETGAVLQARWQINLREKNTPVATGDNRVVGMLLPGDCVRVLEGVSGRLNAWAKVERTRCS